MRWKPPQPQGFTPYAVFKYCLGAAIVLVVLMASISNYDRHPDEANHLSAAIFYENHFFPPEIGDPAVRDSYSVWGVSYLNYHWAEYFFAGKFIFFISPLIQDPNMSARFFNVFLLCLLASLFLYRSRESNTEFIIPCFLLISPQVWYVFSYSNNDAFALFASLLLAYQIAYPKSFLCEFLESERFSSRLIGGLLFGGLVGLLSVCKPNYWVFILFAALWLLFNFPLNALTLKKYALIASIALMVFAFRIGLDFYVNGETNFVGATYINYFFRGVETKQSKLLAYQEEIADFEYKPSTIQQDPSLSNPTVKLKSKGTPAAEMFSKWRWHTFSFESFVGVYGYMNLWASEWYYKTMFLLYLLFGFYLAAKVVVSKNRAAIKQLTVVIFCCLLSIFLSFYLSWNYALQAQGRYIFPAIGMIGIFVYSNRKILHNTLTNVFLLVAFLLSAYSFIFIGLTRINSH